MSQVRTYASIPTDLERQGEIRTKSYRMNSLLNDLISKPSLASMGIPLADWTAEDDIVLQEEMILACKENWDEWLANPQLARDACYAMAIRIATDDRLPPPTPKLTHQPNVLGYLGSFVDSDRCTCDTCFIHRQSATPIPEYEDEEDEDEEETNQLCAYCKDTTCMRGGEGLCADCFWDLDALWKRPGRLARNGASDQEIEEAQKALEAMLERTKSSRN